MLYKMMKPELGARGNELHGKVVRISVTTIVVLLRSWLFQYDLADPSEIPGLSMIMSAVMRLC